MNYTYIYGPIPSRRLGFSLGISPIPKKTCNYSCIYCQLGRTNPLSNTRRMFYPISDIINEFKLAIKENIHYDVVSIVGEGEPTLYQRLGELILELKKITTKPIAVITNGAKLDLEEIRQELLNADIVLPSLNAYDEETFQQINRPYPMINFSDSLKGLIDFSNVYHGQLWLEIMLLQGINDDDTSLLKLKELLKKIRYDRLYLNSPVRPPAESYVKIISHERMQIAEEVLGGIAIDLLSNQLYQSGIADDYEAIISNISRHPMNQFEILAFLKSRNCINTDKILERLNHDEKVDKIAYMGFLMYRPK